MTSDESTIQPDDDDGDDGDDALPAELADMTPHDPAEIPPDEIDQRDPELDR